jgi:MFS family permease
MIVQAKLAALKGIQPHEYLIRFVFGGLVCVAAGLIAKQFGPGIGGLFLAFPAIFPAGASLVESHERKHKARAGIDGTIRGRVVAGVDSAGAALGCIGLAGFALTCWFCLPRLAIAAVFVLATFVWLTLAVMFWLLLKSRIFRRKHKPSHSLLAFRRS